MDRALPSAEPSSIRVLFAFSHADDLEIACGGTAALIARTNSHVGVIVATDDADGEIAARRREEASLGAESLGIARDRVWFLGLPDTRLCCDGDSVGRLRRLLHEKGFWPDLVFTHAPGDQHNDHRALAEIVRSALRNVCRCGAFVVNSFERSRCRPELFVDISRVTDVKRAALGCHRSQAEIGRIRWQDIERLERTFAAGRGLERAEAFEIDDGSDSSPVRRFLTALNSCPFAAFWTARISNRPLCMLSEASTARRSRVDASGPGLRATVDTLRHRLQRLLYCQNDVIERCSDDPDAPRLYDTHDVLLVGGARTNVITATRFNQYGGLRYVVEHDMRRLRTPYIVDRITGVHLTPVVRTTTEGCLEVERDYGLLTVMPNPEAGVHPRAHPLWLIGIMGTYGWGAIAACRQLLDTESLGALAHAMSGMSAIDGFQLVIAVNPRQGSTVDWSSFYRVAAGCDRGRTLD